ncbi:hypothetical protein BJ322DRAFT_1187920 [Thelephora terrestris]|uniref:Secreted protein n=1 Tax=Thelephora terrestris TaxID=56493 RepID=A0A9P6HIB0_9AGAM|nr:hypothetical protein BJ322DRAFT_1187920 [Thelephora terrestris]
MECLCMCRRVILAFALGPGLEAVIFARVGSPNGTLQALNRVIFASIYKLMFIDHRSSPIRRACGNRARSATHLSPDMLHPRLRNTFQGRYATHSTTDHCKIGTKRNSFEPRVDLWWIWGWAVLERAPELVRGFKRRGNGPAIYLGVLELVGSAHPWPEQNLEATVLTSILVFVPFNSPSNMMLQRGCNLQKRYATRSSHVRRPIHSCSHSFSESHTSGTPLTGGTPPIRRC